VNLCLAAWERAVYQGGHGSDPRPAFQQAVAACERAAATRPDSDKYASLGAVYTSLAVYESEHGGDPARAAELGERNLRSAIAIDDRNAVFHYNLGRLLSSVAHYREAHGESPERPVALALSELETSVTMDATRVDARATMAGALISLGRFERAASGAEHRESRSLARARAALQEALALRPDMTAPIRYRMMLAELDAESLLARHADPAPEVARIEADAPLVLRRTSDAGFAHRLRCRAQVFAARWAWLHHRDVARMLDRAASDAQAARAADPWDPRSWTASAEVELVRAEAAPARPAADAATARARAFLDRARALDPRLAWTLAVSRDLARQAEARH